MTKFDAPAYAIGFFGLVFIALSLTSDWLSREFGLRELNPGEKVLGFLLGSALIGFFAIWRWLI